jgi:hypothetical protein
VVAEAVQLVGATAVEEDHLRVGLSRRLRRYGAGEDRRAGQEIVAELRLISRAVILVMRKSLPKAETRRPKGPKAQRPEARSPKARSPKARSPKPEARRPEARRPEAEAGRQARPPSPAGDPECTPFDQSRSPRGHASGVRVNEWLPTVADFAMTTFG